MKSPFEEFHSVCARLVRQRSKIFYSQQPIWKNCKAEPPPRPSLDGFRIFLYPPWPQSRSLVRGYFVPCRRAEWLKAHAWKACIQETVSWFRIPLAPPTASSLTFSLAMRRRENLRVLRDFPSKA